jgi:UDP-glucose 4-epimerase
MKILITGGKGFLAGRIDNFLNKKKLSTILSSRKKAKNIIKINWNSQKKLNELCQNVDVIINCAGLDVHGCKLKSKAFKINANYPLNLFKAAKINNVKLFIFISTFHVYKKALLINEKTSLNKRGIYTLSKIEGEKNLLKEKKSNTKLLILRVCNLFGYPIYENKNCWNLLVNSVVKNLIVSQKFKINSKENNYRNYSSIESFCEFIYNIILSLDKKKKLPNIINYCSDKNLNVKEIYKIISKAIKSKKSKVFFKHSNIKEVKKVFYKSLYQNKFKKIKDKFFNKELNKLILYSKKFF